MRMIIVGGPPSSGKTSVIIHALNNIGTAKKKSVVVKLDCLVSGDEDQYSRYGIKTFTGLSTYICPDHYFSTNIERIIDYGFKNKLEYLIVESAGLCNRCSPHIRNTFGVTVLDVLSGIHAPNKIGPLLKAADCVVLTRSDLISQAEREVFKNRISKVNRKADIIEINGLTGQNSMLLTQYFKDASECDVSVPLQVKYPMPGAVCSFCLGEKRVGQKYASGNVKLIDLPGLPSRQGID
jgi:Ni2+-binding GTPase involved in maturation of urease and hydrogenase